MKQDNSDVGARERNKIKQTFKLGFSQQELNIWPLGDELENSTIEPWGRTPERYASQRQICYHFIVDERMAKIAIVYFNNYNEKYMRKV